MNESNSTINILKLLQNKKPSFQLLSGNAQLSSSEEYLAEEAHDTSHLKRTSFASSLETLQFICNNADRNALSIETGGGWSTCAFAATTGKHFCINPDVTANDMIFSFLKEHKVPIGELNFLGNTSDLALPNIDKSIKFDISLIDGNHSFPIPLIDWHYIDYHLKPNGILILDDAQIRAVSFVCDYIEREKYYVKIAEIGNTFIFKKTDAKRLWGWANQKFNKKPFYISARNFIVCKYKYFIKRSTPGKYFS